MLSAGVRGDEQAPDGGHFESDSFVHVQVKASVQGENRGVTFISWEQLDVGQATRDEAEKHIGPPDSEELVGGTRLCRYNEVFFATERENPSAGFAPRTLTLLYDDDGLLIGIGDPPSDASQ